MGFEQLLYMSFEAFDNREILRWLMNNNPVSSGRVEVKIGTKNLIIKENLEAHVLGVPEGSSESLVIGQRKALQGTIVRAVRIMLGLPGNKKKVSKIMEARRIMTWRMKRRKRRRRKRIEKRLLLRALSALAI